MSHTPIEENFLNRNELFGLEYSEGLVFVSVRDKEDTKFKPFGQLEDISSNSSLSGGFQRLNDSNSDDVLFVDKSTDKHTVLHVGIGQKPAMIRRFTRYPEDDAKLRSIPNLTSPSTNNNYAYVDGRDSPYSQPTDAEELVIPPGIHLNFDFRNEDDDDAHEPILNIKMRIYTIEPLDPRGSQQEKNSIRRIVGVGSTIPTFSVGSRGNQTNFNLEEEWGVSPVSIERARELVN